MSPRRAFACCLLLLALPLIAACAAEETEVAESPSPASAPAPAPTPAQTARDVCAMVSADAVEAATGIKVAGTKSTSGGAEVCTWITPSGKAAIVQVYPYASSYEQSREAFEGLYATDSKELQGLGDKAFAIAGKTGRIDTATVTTAKGTTPISVQVMEAGRDAATLESEATALARVVLDAL